MPQTEIQLPTKETAVIQSSVYSSKDFPSYNPDDLALQKGGLAIYDKMLIDEQVKAVVRFRRDAITGRDYVFEIPGDAISDEEKEKRIALSNAIVERIKGSFKTKLDAIMSSAYYGFSITEKTYETFEFENLTWWGIKSLCKKPVSTFKFYTDDFGNIERFVQDVSDGREIDLDYDKFIHQVHNAEYDELYGRSELREAYRSWWSKDVIIKFQNIHIERHGSGFVWLSQEGDTTIKPGTPAWTVMQDILRNMQVGTGAILPKGITLNMEHPATTDVFDKAIAQHDKGIAKSQLVPNLLGITEQGQVGSYSNSQTQLEAFLWLLDAESKALAETLNEQMFKELGQTNFGDEWYPRIKFLALSDTLKNIVINTWKDLVTAGAVTHTDADESHIRDMMKFPEKSEDDESESETDDDEVITPLPEGREELPEETILPEKTISAAAFSQAEKRVAFAVIDKQSTEFIEGHVEDVSKVFAVMVEEVVAEIKVKKLGTVEGDFKDVKKLRFSTKGKTKLKNEARTALRDGWVLGSRHAKDEVDKAKKETFTADFTRIEELQAQFFDTRAFTMTGKLTADAMAIINNVLSQGVKASASTPQIVENIYTALGEAGMLDPADVDEALGAALNVENPTARLTTWVRTNSFEAINEARYAYFTDPQLGDFVEALQYSAILDSRTTSICTHLNGQEHAIDSDVWATYRPPNHFNCRSLLVPVTKNDVWTEADDPTIDPNKGFGS